MTDEMMSMTGPKKGYLIVKVVGLVLLAAIVALAMLRDRFVTNPMWQVSIVGRGEVSYQPDTAKINIGVTVDRAATAEVALKQLNDSMAKVVGAITGAGIDKKDIQTLNYNLSPQYDYVYPPIEPPGSITPVPGKNVLTGYNADQSLLVTIRDLSEDKGLVSKVIAAAGQAGSNQINSISFESSKINSLKDEARLKAIADAKSKSASLAGAAGVKLGKVIGWWENVVQGPDAYPYYGGKGGVMMDAGAVTPPTLPSGEYKLILEMNLNYEVK